MSPNKKMQMMKNGGVANTTKSVPIVMKMKGGKIVQMTKGGTVKMMSKGGSVKKYK
jgi:hypothetical protein|tara:strand:+ start:1983 stop:2150 length:168 start_codon:yes stop_codon:yes gene_type:complete